MTKTATIIWHDTDNDKPGDDELVLVQDRVGDHYICSWEADADSWSEPSEGFFDRSAIVAWARLPVYEKVTA